MPATPRSLMPVLALLAALAAPLARAQSTNATLAGTIRDAAGSPVAGATVTATSQAGTPPATATTGVDGTFSLSLVAGTYNVRALAPGLWGPTVVVELAAGGDQRLDFSLTAMKTEVVSVTASKREMAPADVPYSLEAHSEEDLRNRGADTIEDVAANVGSFTVQSLGPGQSQVAMRGVSSGQIARDQPGVKEQVGVYLDESPVSMSLFTPDLDLVDLERVEVLRGPQGTLYGSGSETGTVRYITHQPVLNSYEGFVDVGGGLVADGDGVADLKAAFNMPLGETAALRIVGYDTKLAGSTDAIQPDLSTDEDVNDGYRAGFRAAATFAPSDKLAITPRLLFQRLERNGWNLEDRFNILANPFTTSRPAVTFGDREEYTQLEEQFKDDFALADVTVRYDFGPVALTSITSFLDRKVRVVRDTTALTASFTGGNLGLPEPIYTLDSPLFDATDAAIWTQELRFAGSRDKLEWLAGLFYTNGRRDFGQNVTVPGFTAATGIPTQGILAPVDTLYFSDFEYQLDQIALFGEATRAMTDTFSLTAGLRFYDYSEDKEQFVDGPFGNPDNGNSVISLPGSTDSSGVSPRVIATWKLEHGDVVNALVSQGFRLGGINDPLNVPLCSPEDLATFGGRETWEDEIAWNYEVGWRSRRLAGDTSVKVSAFYIDIHDLQTTVTAGTCSSRVVFNVPRARSQGLELEVNAAPSANFDLAFSGSYNDAELRSTLTSTDTLGNVSIVSGIEEGRRLPTVPELQGALSAIYRFEVARGARMYLTGTYQYVGSRFTQVGDEDLGTLDMTTLPNTIGGPLTQSLFTYDPELPAYSILNARIGWQHRGWDVSLYVNNALDELAYLALERERGTVARVGYLTNQPRTVGLAARFSF